MLYLDTCVLLAVLLPEVHSALGLMVRTGCLAWDQADRVLQTFEQELAPALVMLELLPVDFRHADAWRLRPGVAPASAAWISGWCRRRCSWGWMPA